MSKLDLILFKIFSCGLRYKGVQKIKDFQDAVSLLNSLDLSQPVHLEDCQRNAVDEGGFEAVLEESDYNRTWWVS